MESSVLNCFVGGMTAQGYQSLWETNLHGLDRIFVIRGGATETASAWMKEMGELFADKGISIEIIHNFLDPQNVIGVIVPLFKTGIILADVQVKQKNGVTLQEINLDTALHAHAIELQKGYIETCVEIKNKYLENMQKFFEKALKIHDKWEKIYIKNMNKEAAGRLLDGLCRMIYRNRVVQQKGFVKHRFMGAATPNGAVDFIENLTENIGTRYFLKGRPGTGKSTLLKKLVAEGEKRGFDVEAYHCGFDFQSLDMVIVRQLGIAVIDATAPHEYFPSRAGDEIIDLYDHYIAPGTDQRYAKKLKRISRAYGHKISQATGCLISAKEMQDKLEEIYHEAADKEKLEEMRAGLVEEVTVNN